MSTPNLMTMMIRTWRMAVFPSPSPLPSPMSPSSGTVVNSPPRWSPSHLHIVKQCQTVSIWSQSLRYYFCWPEGQFRQPLSKIQISYLLMATIGYSFWWDLNKDILGGGYATPYNNCCIDLLWLFVGLLTRMTWVTEVAHHHNLKSSRRNYQRKLLWHIFQFTSPDLFLQSMVTEMFHLTFPFPPSNCFSLQSPASNQFSVASNSEKWKS